MNVNLLRAISRFECELEHNNALCQAYENSLVSFKGNDIIFMHRLQFLLFKHILKIPEITLEKKFAQHLSAELVFLQEKYKEYINCLKDITNYLECHEINYCVLKGFSIIDSLYTDNNIIYRDFGDMDILINKKDVEATSKGLIALGYIQGYLDSNYKMHEASRKDILKWRLNSHQEQPFIKSSKYTNVSPILNCKVDINTTIFDGGKVSLPVPTHELLLDTRTHKLRNGLSIRSLNYEYELIQLCYHFYKDIIYATDRQFYANYTLIKFCDLREYILKYKECIDWEKFIFCVNSCEIGHAVYTTLHLVSNFYKDLHIENIMERIIATKHSVVIPDWDSILL